jgi:AcrR family transcriptional regulator
MTELEKGPQGRRRGRGARERILGASQQLFRDQGINRTGMDQLCAAAQVSKRTAYQHFTGKDELVAEYLRRFDPDVTGGVFDRTDLTPRERLLAAFEVPATGAQDITPTCPYIAASIEIHDPQHPARQYARDYKKAFAARFAETAREAGATNPEQLGEQLALLLDGASARSRVLNTETLATAAAIAAVLVDKAIPTAAVPLGAGGNPSAGTGRVPDAATSSAEVDAEYAAAERSIKESFEIHRIAPESAIGARTRATLEGEFGTAIRRCEYSRRPRQAAEIVARRWPTG